MLDELEKLGVFEVKLEGDCEQSYLTRKSVLYFEWLYGEKDEKGWVSYSTAYHSEKPFNVITPAGTLELQTNRLRPYLAPSFEKAYSGDSIKDAPPAVKAYYEEKRTTVSVEEYCLEPGRIYYAKVETETYYLPPMPDEEKPVRRHNKVLALSDLPFQDGKPRRQLTPLYRGWTY